MGLIDLLLSGISIAMGAGLYWYSTNIVCRPELSFIFEGSGLDCIVYFTSLSIGFFLIGMYFLFQFMITGNNNTQHFADYRQRK